MPVFAVEGAVADSLADAQSAVKEQSEGYCGVEVRTAHMTNTIGHSYNGKTKGYCHAETLAKYPDLMRK